MKINPGTYEGDTQEIYFVKFFNDNKDKYNHFIGKFDLKPIETWLIRVTSKQFSSLSNKKVFTRSDAYLITSLDKRLSDYIKFHNGYIDENILGQEDFFYNVLPYSGISIKLNYSKKYQILKTGPLSFEKLFGSYELGAGASLFCKRQTELVKNLELIAVWGTTVEKMNDYFLHLTKKQINFETDRLNCEKIKKYSIKKISDMIDTSIVLQEKIFNGKTLYKEPYAAWYFTQGKKIKKLTYLPFRVTTGSGRSKGDYTIVLKPV
jgi:hypothetical protein